MAVNKHHDESLRLLIQKTRETSLTLLKDVSAEQARWLPIGEVNSILWHAGHVFVVVERCIFAAVAGSEDIPPSIPGGWWAVFGWNSKPWEIDPEAWPSLAQVRRHLEKQLDDLQGTLSIYDDSFLSSPITWSDPRWYGQPKRLVILHGFYDELLHSGQIKQLKSLYKHETDGPREAGYQKGPSRKF